MTALVSHRHNLPAQVSSFIGRERELEEIARLLRQHRLITLTGSGGSGKTRLALRAAEAALDHYADGVWLAALAPLTAPELVCGTIAKAVGAPETGAMDPLDALGGFLSRKQVLLVVDNCEHLLAECARVVAALLARCPALGVLATSREPLAAGGEWVLRVPPLSVPDAARPLDPAHLLAHDGVRLFVERARAAEPSFQLTSVSAAPVVEICRRLDGLPLALELAAVRVRGMGVAYLGERLDDRFRLLTGGNRAGEPRQRTLLALVDWSYDLLAAREQATLRRLCVFRGGFVAEAAQAVCAGEEDDEDASNSAILDDLARLVDKSLVQFDHEAERYRLLETILLYGAERLGAAGEAQRTRQRHLAYYLRLVESGAAQIGGPGQQAWFARLEREHDNLRAALGWAIDTGHADEAARLALGLWRFWRAQTYQREGLRWLERIRALDAASPLPDALRPWLFNALGVLGHSTYAFDRARADHAEALRLWTEAGDEAGMARALIDAGWQAFDEVDVAQTKRHAVEGLALAERGGDRHLIASALSLSATADLHADMRLVFHYDERAQTEAHSLLSVIPTVERSLAIWRELGDSGGVASALVLLGAAYQAAGQYEHAKPLLAESARLHVRLGDYGNLTGTLVGLMLLAANSAHEPEMAREAARMSGVLAATQAMITAATSPWDAAEPARRLAEKLIGLLGIADYERAIAEGRQMTTAELLAPVDRITAPSPRGAESAPSMPVAPASGLTPRELEVLRLVARGMTNAQVAEALVITPRTVNAHLTAIYGKLGVTSRGGAIRYAVSHHLDEP